MGRESRCRPGRHWLHRSELATVHRVDIVVLPRIRRRVGHMALLALIGGRSKRLTSASHPQRRRAALGDDRLRRNQCLLRVAGLCDPHGHKPAELKPAIRVRDHRLDHRRPGLVAGRREDRADTGRNRPGAGTLGLHFDRGPHLHSRKIGGGDMSLNAHPADVGHFQQHHARRDQSPRCDQTLGHDATFRRSDPGVAQHDCGLPGGCRRRIGSGSGLVSLP